MFPRRVFRCKDENGNTVFSDTWCETETEALEVVESSGGLSQTESDGLNWNERRQLRSADWENKKATSARDSRYKATSNAADRAKADKARRCQDARRSYDSYKKRQRTTYKARDYNDRKSNESYYKDKVRKNC